MLGAKSGKKVRNYLWVVTISKSRDGSIAMGVLTARLLSTIGCKQTRTTQLPVNTKLECFELIIIH